MKPLKGLKDPLESLLKSDRSNALKSRIGELLRAARQEEREKLLKRFVLERQSWNQTRKKDLSEMRRLRGEIKQRDAKISSLATHVEKTQTCMSRLQHDFKRTRESLDGEITTRLHNAKAMRELSRMSAPQYPAWLGLQSVSEVDPFEEVALDLLQRSKLEETGVIAQGSSCEVNLSALGTDVPVDTQFDYMGMISSATETASSAATTPTTKASEPVMDISIPEAFLN